MLSTPRRHSANTCRQRSSVVCKTEVLRLLGQRGHGQSNCNGVRTLFQNSNIDTDVCIQGCVTRGTHEGDSNASIASQHDCYHKINPCAPSGCPQTPCSLHTGVLKSPAGRSKTWLKNQETSQVKNKSWWNPYIMCLLRCQGRSRGLSSARVPRQGVRIHLPSISNRSFAP